MGTNSDNSKALRLGRAKVAATLKTIRLLLFFHWNNCAIPMRKQVLPEHSPRIREAEEMLAQLPSPKTTTV
ncbi:MAG: hypothetical protein SGJ27_22010 [Candidatus Melainabacteria bacterium]|nr:hypothetical protein [Candidatus Melainabacteria bacterium]